MKLHCFNYDNKLYDNKMAINQSTFHTLKYFHVGENYHHGVLVRCIMIVQATVALVTTVRVHSLTPTSRTRVRPTDAVRVQVICIQDVEIFAKETVIAAIINVNVGDLLVGTVGAVPHNTTHNMCDRVTI